MIGALAVIGLILCVIAIVAIPAIFIGRVEQARLMRVWLRVADQLPPDQSQTGEVTYWSVPIRFGNYTMGNKFDLHAFRLHLDLGEEGLRLHQEQSIWGLTAKGVASLFIPWNHFSKAVFHPHDSGIIEETGLFLEVAEVLDESGAPFSLQIYSDCAVLEEIRERVAEHLQVTGLGSNLALP